MRVGLIDVDRTTWRNLHLMRRASYHKARGDEAIFPYDGAQKVDRVFMSSVFTRNLPLVGKWLRLLTGKDWDVNNPTACDLELGLYDIEVGGTGWNIHAKAPDEVEDCKPDYSLYDGLLGPADYGQGFTTRGCPRNCHFCVVPIMSGRISRPIATLADLRNGGHKRIKLMDDNFWAPTQGEWWRERLIEAIDGKYDVSFTQGLDIRFVDEERAQLLSRVRFWTEGFTNRMVTFAFDSPDIEFKYRQGFARLLAAGIKPYQIASFVLMGFGSTPEQDLRRLDVLRELGAYPYAMVYEPIHGELVPEFYAQHPEAFAYYYEHGFWTNPGLPLDEQYRRHWQMCKHMQRYCNKRQLWGSIRDFREHEPFQKQIRHWQEQDRKGLTFAVGAATHLPSRGGAKAKPQPLTTAEQATLEL